MKILDKIITTLVMLDGFIIGIIVSIKELITK